MSSYLTQGNEAFARAIEEKSCKALLCIYRPETGEFRLAVRRHWNSSVDLLISTSHAEIAKAAENKAEWYSIAHNPKQETS